MNEESRNILKMLQELRGLHAEGFFLEGAALDWYFGLLKIENAVIERKTPNELNLKQLRLVKELQKLPQMGFFNDDFVASKWLTAMIKIEHEILYPDIELTPMALRARRNLLAVFN